MKPISLTASMEKAILDSARRYASRAAHAAVGRRYLPEVLVGFDCIAECQHWTARVVFDQASGAPFIASWEHADAPGANEKLRTLEELRAANWLEVPEEKKK
jgi:hypothetical protein